MPGYFTYYLPGITVQAFKLDLELLAVRTICASKEAGVSLLNTLTKDHFASPTGQLMYRRLMARLRSEGVSPSWDDLINDATIPEDKKVTAARVVNKKKLKPLISKRKGDALFESLDRYRKLRVSYEIVSKYGNALKQPAVDIDKLISDAKSGLISIDVNSRGAPIVIDGVKGAHVKEALTNVDARIPTGFSEFDERSGGIPQGAVFMMGAESGQFKSVVAMQMAKNVAKEKRPLCFYSLEMPQPEITQRLTANELEVAVSDEINKWQWLRRKAKNAQELDQIDSKHFRWANDIAERYEKSSSEWAPFLHITCPADAVDINWVLQQAEMSDREIIVIDYLGLLEGLAGDDQWRAMSNVARQCKIWTNRTGKTIILLGQMRFEDGKPELKYSKAVKDHVNNLLSWSVLEVSGRTYLCVHQPKARGSKAYHFVLRVWPEFNKVGDLVDARDEEVAANAVEDMKAGKDPAKRYAKAIDENDAKGRKEVDLDEDEPLLQNGGFASGQRAKVRDVSADTSRNNREASRFNSAKGITASAIREQANQRTRQIALAKLKTNAGNLSLEEAAIQAEEVIKRWEEASAGHRMQVTKLAKELLGLSQTKDVLTQVRKLQGDKAALRKLTKTEQEIHKAQVEVIKQATAAIKAKGREYVSEDDFYAKDDLVLSVERGEEPIAPAATLDEPWQHNAVAWADQPAITLPNSAKPKDKRWGANGDELSVQRFKRTVKAWENSKVRKIPAQRMVLWPPKHGNVDDYHYLDDVQLDTVVQIAEKLAIRDAAEMPLDDLAREVGKYVELMGPGIARIRNRKRKKFVYSEDGYRAACKKFGLKYE